MISLDAIRNAWNRFFFEPVSPLPIALYRWVFGFVVLVNQAMLLPDVRTWFSVRGAIPPETALHLSGGRGFNLLRFLPETDASAWFILGLSFVVAFTLMIGLFSRASAAILFLTLITLHHRNVIILMSGDSFLRIGSFYLMFSHAGNALSVDRWLKARRGIKGPPEPAAPWATRLIQLQLSFLYLYAFAWKASGAMWLNGTALYYTSRLTEFWRFPVPYMLEHMWTIRWSSWLTLVAEFSLGTLIWVKELRYPVLIIGVLLHLGIEYSMNIPLFGLVMVSAYVTFLEPQHVASLVNWITSRAKALFPRSR